MLLFPQRGRGHYNAAKREGGKRDKRGYRGTKATHPFASSNVDLILS
jgi:hypothetical protein